MTHGSLFSGIGGFDLAAHWMGWDNTFHCEWNPFGQKVLKHHFPNSISYNDITKTDFTIHEGRIDILTGGFPCQPYSTAGKRLGKADERHLFPQMLRAIKEIKPRYIVGENVRGLVSWNGGMVFNEVCDDLEREGYEVQPFLIPAASVNAPHQRQRIWFIAYSNGIGSGQGGDRGQAEQFDKDGKEGLITHPNNERGGTGFSQVQGKNGKISEWNNHAESSNTSNASNSTSFGQKHPLENRELEGGRFRESDERNFWDSFPSKPPLCGGDDGIPRELDSISFPKWRNESIKAYGNAVVPQLAFEIFKIVAKFEEKLKK